MKEEHTEDVLRRQLDGSDDQAIPEEQSHVHEDGLVALEAKVRNLREEMMQEDKHSCMNKLPKLHLLRGPFFFV